MNFADLIAIIFLPWLAIYLVCQVLGGIVSLFNRGLLERDDIIVKIRRQK